MDMPAEVRIGRRVPQETENIAREVVRLVHAQIPLDSARIYAKSALFYTLTVVPEGRSTLVTLDFQTNHRIETRAQVVMDLIRENEKDLDKADERNAAPHAIERAVAAYTHAAGDGSWFRTAVRHLARRTQLLRKEGVVPGWPRIHFNIDDTMENDDDHGVRFIGRGTPGLIGLKLTLPAETPVIRSLDDAEGILVDQLVDHPLVNGSGLIAKKAWKSDSQDKSLGRVTLMLASDLIPLDEAARLVDAMRAGNEIVSTTIGRTNFRGRDDGYEHPEGTTPEHPNSYNYGIENIMRDRREEAGAREPATTTLPSAPSVTSERRIESMTRFLREKGLESEWIAVLIEEEQARNSMSTPLVCIERKEEEGYRSQDAYINIAPWLQTAAIEDIISLIQIDGQALNEDREDKAMMDAICEACSDYRNDRDDEYHIRYPDEWRYNVWMPHLRKDIAKYMRERRPNQAEATEKACSAADACDERK